MKKLLFTSALFLFLLVIFSKTLSAQGTFTCAWNSKAIGRAQGGVCNSSSVGCDSGYEDSCSSYKTSASCDQQINTICVLSKKTSQAGSNAALCADGGIDTAIGCIPFGSTDALVGFILRWAIGVGGGIAFLLIIVASFQIMTSSGNPERLKAGQELLTSAIAGLIMLVFSVFILKLIGVDILKLPGLVQ